MTLESNQKLESLRAQGYQLYLDALDVSALPGELRQVLARFTAPQMIAALYHEGFELLVKREPVEFLLLAADGNTIPLSATDESVGDEAIHERATIATARQLIHLLALADWGHVRMESLLAEMQLKNMGPKSG